MHNLRVESPYDLNHSNNYVKIGARDKREDFTLRLCISDYI